MSDAVRASLIGLLVFATSIWVGGYVAIGVVARVATVTLTPDHRVEFFRALGRRYARVALPALLVAFTTGALLLADRGWDGGATAAAVLAGALACSLAIGIGQARRMTRWRGAALAAPGDAQLAERVRRGARRAVGLRVAIGLLSFALIGLGAALVR